MIDPGIDPSIDTDINTGKTSEKSWVVYIVNCADATLYTGITNDLEKRLQAHDAGVGAKYTKNRGPVQLLYCENAHDRSAASKREHTIKKLSRAQKILLIQSADDRGN